MCEGVLGHPPAPPGWVRAFVPKLSPLSLFVSVLLSTWGAFLLSPPQHAVAMWEEMSVLTIPAAPPDSGGNIGGPAVLTVAVLVGPGGKQIAEA